MISRDSDLPYKGFIQDLDYSLSWRKFLVRLGLAGNEWGDWDDFVAAECLKLAEKRREALDAAEQKAEEEAIRRAHQAADGQESADKTQVTAEVESSQVSDAEGPQQNASQRSGEAVPQSLSTEDDDGLDAVEQLAGVQVPIHSPQNDQRRPSEEELKRQCKLRTVRSLSSRYLSHPSYISF